MLLFIMLITALNLLFSELHSNVICATKFYSEMLPIKSTCSYVLSERSMALIFGLMQIIDACHDSKCLAALELRSKHWSS